MSTNQIKWMAFAALVILALAAPGFASPLPVTNFSFETLPGGGLNNAGCGVGCAFSTLLPITGWTTTGGPFVGQFQPGPPATTTYFNAVPDGITVAYSNGSTISQQVAATVQAGVVYTLLVDIGSRKDLTGGFTGTADLLIGGVTTVIATGAAPTPGAFGTFTAKYTGLSADVGKSIAIELRSTGAQGDFDNVRLDASTVPEPASLMLVGLALMGLKVFGRRRPDSKESSGLKT